MKDFWLEALRREGTAFRTAVSAEVLDQPVPSCPKWTVERLVGHLGTVYRWEELARTTGAAPDRSAMDRPPPGAAVLPWWDESFDQAVRGLTEADPDAPAWNWSTAPAVAGFWHRRMAHETAVHRWDAQVATGLPEPIEPELAADGVAEWIDTFLAAGRGRPVTTEAVVRLVAEDLDRSWHVRLREGGPSLLDDSAVFDDPAAPDTEASGHASDLLLALWGRVATDVLAVKGDPEPLELLRNPED